MNLLRRLNVFYILLFFFSFPILSYVYELLNTDSNFLSIALRAVTLGVALVFFALNIRFSQVYKTIDFWLFLAFWIIYTIRIVFDTTFNNQFLGQEPINYYLFGPILSFICVLPFFNRIRTDEAKLEAYIYTITFMLCFFGVLYAITSDKFFTDRARGNHKLNEITFGVIGVILAIISVKRIFLPKPSLIKKVVSVISFGLGMTCLLMSGSKSPTISFIIFLLFFLFKSSKSRPIKTTGLLMIIIIGITYIIIRYKLYFIFDVFKYRIQSFSSDQSTVERTRSFTGAWRQFLESPLWGSYIEEKSTRKYPHNIVLESFMALGIPGGILFCVLYIRFFFKSFYCLVRSNFSILTILALTQLILSFSSGSLGFSFEFWAAVAIISVYSKEFSRRQTTLLS